MVNDIFPFSAEGPLFIKPYLRGLTSPPRRGSCMPRANSRPRVVPLLPSPMVGTTETPRCAGQVALRRGDGADVAPLLVVVSCSGFTTTQIPISPQLLPLLWTCEAAQV